MTAANNGASTPEDDDPFGYLYEDGRAAGATPPGQGRGYGYPGPAAQPGVPRTSYNQVRTVGERQYGQQVPQQHAYGQQQGYAQGQPTAQYAAPETYPGGAPTRQVPPQGNGSGHGGHGGGRSGGPNTKGLLIGAIAVVAVVVIGIGAALLTGGGQDDKAGGSQAGNGGATAGESVKPSDEPSASDKPAELPKQDAATLQLGAPAVLAKDVKGAQGADGAYVTGFNAVGASVTWKASVSDTKEYRLYVRYAIPAQDANATLTVNGKANSNPLGLKNFIKSSDPNPEKNWQTTWAPVNLQKGENEIKISCEAGNQCNALLDWLQVSDGEL
ncbi:MULTISPECIES: CBM35 domain-containing protein [unclassified Streptomyces]|uniref:CBM35 domain-containing protein n=1 Tax=unclassified Streptomyces TaxID=2593676 RepID=UPI002DD7BB86|nr:CBM35 domain-containing protein [Streptomyces sp. NBC_01750]WSB02011.1 carbohydrate-binding protein [Streptomyces sp. NBC_01794]WSD33721.1 carbohydrate-binding protein [Streptomyces sp. NBC_01750]